MSGMTGNEFKSIREELELNQDQLAEVLCISGKQAVSNIETGFRNPSKLMATIMRVFVELPERRSRELREMMISLADGKRSQRTRQK
jgi:DNA-binding transcriptional regulator YiaG